MPSLCSCIDPAKRSYRGDGGATEASKYGSKQLTHLGAEAEVSIYLNSLAVDHSGDPCSRSFILRVPPRLIFPVQLRGNFNSMVSAARNCCVLDSQVGTVGDYIQRLMGLKKTMARGK